jgi:hypothetical protein
MPSTSFAVIPISIVLVFANPFNEANAFRYGQFAQGIQAHLGSLLNNPVARWGVN